MANAFHENFALSKPALGSDRSFGLVFAGVFTVVGLLPLLRDGDPRIWAVALGLAFLAVALAAPRVLHDLNTLWFRFGLLLGAIVLPVVMAILFFGMVTPLAAIRRLAGKPGLQLKYDASEQSYWIPRETPIDREGLRRQF
jgi:hypothetical protein